MGYELYREIRDMAPAEWTSGMRLVALMIADDANDQTRRSFIENPVLCQRAGLEPSGVKTALQRLGRAGYEMRVAHGTDTLGRPVYAVRGRRTEYLVPPVAALVRGCHSPAIPVDRPPARGGHSPAIRGWNGGATASYGGATAPYGGATASQPDATASPISSVPHIPSVIPSPAATPELDLGDDTPAPATAAAVDNLTSGGGRWHMTALEAQAWEAIGGRQ